MGHVAAAGGRWRGEDVAIVADRLLARDDTERWFDLLGGEEPIDEAVERVATGKIDSIGERMLMLWLENLICRSKYLDVSYDPDFRVDLRMNIDLTKHRTSLNVTS